jgi:hypothetical protein
MATTRLWARLLIGAATLWIGVPAGAQKAQTFRARLLRAPVENANAASIAGRGSVSAILTDTKLAISGTFEGLRTPATVAHVHRGLRGVRGPAIFDLTVAKTTSGAVSGELTLTPAQVDELRKGRLYIQIHSAGAPEGNLWGWLLP